MSRVKKQKVWMRKSSKLSCYKNLAIFRCGIGIIKPDGLDEDFIRTHEKRVLKENGYGWREYWNYCRYVVKGIQVNEWDLDTVNFRKGA